MIPSKALSLLRERIAYLVGQSAKEDGIPLISTDMAREIVEQLVDKYKVTVTFAEMTVSDLVLEAASAILKRAE